MKIILLSLCLIISSASAYSKTKRVLFLGNSYTYFNDLPKMLADMAISTGDTLIYDSNTPGGHSIGDHSFNTVSLGKIMAGNWDFVVLQGQSFELTSTTPEKYPYLLAKRLDSIINKYNDCAETVYYMTWGRKYGDPSSCPTVPYLCTYEKMDSIIHRNYMWLTDTTDAIVSPVGAVWRSIRKSYPLIDLYQSDESHPSVAGTYAAACAFYTTLYRKDPSLITYNPGLTVTEASNIRNTAKLVVFDSLLHWHIGEYDHIVNPKCATTSIKEEQPDWVLNIAPNPVSDMLSIQRPGQSKEQLVQVYNSIGVLITELKMIKTAELNVSEYPNGLYFIRFKDNPSKAYTFIRN
ncbi:MAG: T9SS type A sorting domain-containing protein [Bacteroidota bacterium]